TRPAAPASRPGRGRRSPLARPARGRVAAGVRSRLAAGVRSRLAAEVRDALGGDAAEQQRQQPDGAGPAGLVAGPDPGAVVAVEVLVEQDQVAPVRVVAQDRLSTVYRPVPVGVGAEAADEPVADFAGHLVKVAPAA